MSGQFKSSLRGANHGSGPGRVGRPILPCLLLTGAVLWFVSFAAVMAQAGGKPSGSRLPAEENACAACHTERELWTADNRNRFIAAEKLAADVHARNGVNCHDCHGGDPASSRVNEAHARENGFRAKGTDVWNSCARCHQAAAKEMAGGVHAKAGPTDARGSGPLGCAACHAGDPHQMASVHDAKSPVFVSNQVQTCGRCHEKDSQQYLKSVHGRGLVRSGLQVTAVCADCHGAHGIHLASDPRSTLAVARVGGTCGRCHPYLEEQVQASAHGGGKSAGPNGAGENACQSPTCTSCHPGHEIGPAGAAFNFRKQAEVCGKCHSGPSGNHAMSLHAALGELGYPKAPRCSDCHGAHAVFPASHPGSTLAAENRRETCGRCHPGAAANFFDFNPDADSADPHRNPIVHFVYQHLLFMLILTFGISGVHSACWLVRSAMDVRRNGRPARPKAGAVVFRRFRRADCICHSVMIVAFLGLVLTGLPLKYNQTGWAKRVAYWLGGFDATNVWHRIFALALFSLLILYVVRLARGYFEGRRQGMTAREVIFGPESPVPNRRDARDFVKMLRWFVGLGPKPTFERWAYWEKLDFWAAQADIVIIGLTGLVLWFPHFFTAFLPALVINIAKVVHSTQALLATGFVFAVHLFNTQIRPDKFPADMSILTGLVTEEEFREERGDHYERLRREGALDGLRRKVPSRRNLWLVTAGGLTVLAVGLSLLLAIVTAS